MFDDNTQPDGTAATSRRWPMLLLLLVLVLALVLGGAMYLLRSAHGSSVPGSAGAGESTSTSSVPTQPPYTSGPTPTESTNPVPPGDGGGSGGGGSSGGGGTVPPPVVHETRALGIGATVTGPEFFRGVCPVTLEYGATVTVTRAPVDITYRWTGGAVQRAHLSALHTTLSTRVIPAPDSSGSETLQILSPVAIASNVAHYEVSCVHVSVGTATVSSPAFTGDCSHGHTFTTSATITAINGPVLVRYHWVRTDGGTGPESSVLVPAGSGSATVSTSWTFFNSVPPRSGPFVGGERLVLDDPFSASTNAPEFSVWCI